MSTNTYKSKVGYVIGIRLVVQCPFDLLSHTYTVCLQMLIWQAYLHTCTYCTKRGKWEP